MNDLPTPVLPGSSPQPVNPVQPNPVTPQPQPQSNPLGGIPGGMSAINPETNQPYVKHENPLETLGRLVGEKPTSAPSPFNSIVPVDVAAGILGHIPLPTADASFDALGVHFRATGNTAAYQAWAQVREQASADVLTGGSQKAKFVKDYVNYAQIASPTGAGGLGNLSPEFAAGPGGIGSVGDAVSSVVSFIMGVPSNLVQRQLADLGQSDPSKYSGHTTADYSGKQANLTRLAWAEYKYDHPDQHQPGSDEPLSDLEKTIVQRVRAGTMTPEHAKDLLVTQGEGFSTNPFRQIVTQALTDPLTYAAFGEGVISDAVKVGARVHEAGLGATNAYEKVALKMYQADQVPGLHRVWQAMGTLANPFPSLDQVPQASSVVRNWYDGTAVAALGEAYPGAVNPTFAAVGKVGDSAELAQDMGSYARYQSDLLYSKETLASELKLAPDKGEGLIAGSTPSDVLAAKGGDFTGNGIERLKDHMYQVAFEPTSPAELDQLAKRAAAAYGGGTEYWQGVVAKASTQTRSLLHAVTFENPLRKFMQALSEVDHVAYKGKAPIDRFTLVNERTLTDVSGNSVVEDVRNAPTFDAALAEWESATRLHPELQNIGVLPRTQSELDKVVARLEQNIKSGKYIRVMKQDELAKPALYPIQNFLDSNTIDGERLWEVGFLPESADAWGATRDAITGKLIADRYPVVPHVVDAQPARIPYGEVTRNHLGQNLGGAVAAPFDTISSMVHTVANSTSSRQVMENQAKGFERSMLKDLGVPRNISRDLWDRATELSGRNRTTIKGARPTNDFWNEIKGAIPQDFRLADGSALDVHTVLDKMLIAAGGDMRMVGTGPVLAQRSRDIMRRAGIKLKMGDGGNWTGWMTTEMYQKLRYANPMFYLQRMTDSGYLGLFRGIAPVGKTLPKELEEVRALERQIGLSMTSRDFAMTNQELTISSNWGQGITDGISKVSGRGARLKAINEAGELMVANNMTKQLNARLGRVVRETLDLEYSKAEAIVDPAEKASAIAYLEDKYKNLGEWRAILSRNAGRTLTDDEVGLKFIQSQMHSGRNMKVTADGVDPTDLVREMNYHVPTDIGDIPDLLPDHIATKMGYKDARELRRALKGYVTKDKEGRIAMIQPTRDRAWLQNWLQEELGAHPDFTRRFVHYFDEDWSSYWERLQRPVADGGMDLSPHAVKDAQHLIGTWAAARGMDPWEFTVNVLQTNLGPGDSPEKALLQFLQAGGVNGAPFDAWVRMFRGNLDLSAQRTLLEHFRAAEPTAVEPSSRAAFEGQTLADAVRRDMAPPALTAEQGAQIQAIYDEEKALRAAGDTAGADAKAAEGAALQKQFTAAPGAVPGFGVPPDAERKTAEAAVQQAGFSKVSNEKFYASVRKAAEVTKSNGRKVGETLYVHTKGDYRKMDLYLTADGKTGFAIKPDGDLVSVFNVGDKGRIEAIVPHLHGLGATKLDAFNESGRLPGLYAKGGFKVSRTVPWDPQYAPPGWTGGTPDVVYMTHHAEALKPAVGELKPEALDATHLYHGTSPANFDAIRAEGLKPGTSGLGFFESSDIPNWSVRSDRIALRTDKTGFPSSSVRAGGAIHTTAMTIPPQSLEYLGKDGLWHPLAPRPTVPHVFDSPVDYAAKLRLDKKGLTKLPKGFRPEGGYVYTVANGDVAMRGFHEGTAFTTDPTHLLASDIENDAIYRIKARSNLARAKVTGQSDRVTSKAIPAPDIEVLGADGKWRPLPGNFDEEFDKALGEKLLARAKTGVPDPNPEVESYYNHFSNWLRQSMEGSTRADLGHLVDNIPTDKAVSFNHTESRIRNTIIAKLKQEWQDIFMLAEMGNTRTVAMRSINHPVFGIYPAAYMWGKVLPQTLKFLGRNPYGFTYAMLNIQRSIAMQREFDPNFEHRMAAIDRSATAFLLGYATPSLPWEEMQASPPPFMRSILAGNANLGAMWDSELKTVDPHRWFNGFFDVAAEGEQVLNSVTQQKQADPGNPLNVLERQMSQQPGAATPPPSNEPTGFHGPTQATGLQPVLTGEMQRLNDLFGS